MELQGHRIAVTRPADGNDMLATLLRRHGADVVSVPLIRTAPPADPGPLVRAVSRLAEYDWIVFTSATGVRALAAAAPTDGDAPAARVAAVGTATAAAVVAQLGWGVDAVPTRFSGAALCAAMTAVAPVAGAKVLWPRARDARPELSHALLQAGALIDAPEAYSTELLPDAATLLRDMVAAGTLSAIALTSPSAVDALAAAAPLGGAVVLAAIGPSTAFAAQSHGMTVHVQADEHSAAGLVEALVRHFGNTTLMEE